MFFLQIDPAVAQEKTDSMAQHVTSTINQLKTMPVQDAFDTIIKQLISFGWNLLICVVIYLVGRWIIKGIDRGLDKMFTKRKVEISISKFVRSLIRAVLYVFVVLAIINKLGIDNSILIALLGATGVGVGMALSGTLQNFAGGVMVLLTRPFKIGDYVQMQGIEGTVKEIKLFSTTVNTLDNKLIILPNGNIINNIINNFSAEHVRRIEWTFGISYGDDYQKAREAILELIAKDARIMNEPAPFIALNELADSSVNVVVRVWAKSEDFWGVFYDLNASVYKTLPEKGISFPFPQMDVHLPKEN